MKESGFLAEITIDQRAALHHEFITEFAAGSHRWDTPSHPDPSGLQFQTIKAWLIRNPRIKYFWYDFWCMPQDERTEAEKAEFTEMLANINCLYLGCRVLILADLSTQSRFWTQFEIWLAMQMATPSGLVAAPEGHRRWEIICIHNAAGTQVGDLLASMWADRTPEEAHAILKRPDVTVTNQRDKDQQLPKLLAFNAVVRSVVQDMPDVDLAIARPPGMAPAEVGAAVTPADIPKLADVPLTVPELPACYFVREEDLRSLKDALLTGNCSNTALTSVTKKKKQNKVGAHGMGGVGKTTIAAALIEDEDIRKSFDRIVWVSVGQEPDIRELQDSIHF